MNHRLVGRPRLALVCLAAIAVPAVLSGCVAEPAAPATSPTSSSASSASPTPRATDASTPAPSEQAPTAAPGDPVSVTMATLDYVGDGVEASGIVSGIVEDDGQCTLTLESSGVTLEAVGPATAGTQTTYCGLLALKDARLTTGTWTATLSYASAAHKGRSDSAAVEVP